MTVRSQRLIVIGAAVAGFASCAAVGVLGGIPAPAIHDEFSYLLAADTFASGRLANPAHPLWPHFETFHVLMQPTYASKFPPGQGLVLALGQLAGHPILGVWAGIAGFMAAMAWMLCGSAPRTWALLGVGAGLALFAGAGNYGQSYWGGGVSAAGGALVWGAARRWCHRGTVRDGVTLAAGLAVLALTRPFEGAVSALPPLVAAVASAWSGRGRRTRRLAATMLPILGCVVLWSGYYNHRVTGDPLRLPYVHHTALYSPVPLWTFGTMRAAPEYRHERLRRFHLEYERRWMDDDGSVAITRMAPAKLRHFWRSYLGWPGLIALLALPWALRDRWNRLALVSVLGTLAATALLSTYGGESRHLAPIAAPIVLLQVAALRSWWSLPARGRWIAGLVLGLVCVAHVDRALGRIGQHRRHETSWSRDRASLQTDLAARPGRDLVLVRYGRRHNVHREWVYNRAQLEDAEVVWARSMDPQRDQALREAFPDHRAWRLFLPSGPSSPRLEPYRSPGEVPSKRPSP